MFLMSRVKVREMLLFNFRRVGRYLISTPHVPEREFVVLQTGIWGIPSQQKCMHAAGELQIMRRSQVQRLIPAEKRSVSSSGVHVGHNEVDC